MAAKPDRRIRVVLCSPSDVNAERLAIKSLVKELNVKYAITTAKIDLFTWETDAHPNFHPEGAEGQILQDMKLHDCDIVIGLFWARFGKPVLGSKSGTEHELKAAIGIAERQNWKKPRILLLF